MKLFHISDLHIGLRLYETPIADDQRYILNQILDLCVKEKPDGVIIAGDIYDRAVPSAEAVAIFDEFLTGLKNLGIYVFAIYGNHDSAERIAYGARIMAENRIFLSPVYDGHIEPVILNDEYGEVRFYLLPFIKPAVARQFFNAEINSYDDAVRTAVSEMNIDASKRNIIVAHQFVTGAQTAMSEEHIVGGTENISADIFEEFDYAALGHIHRPQKIKSDFIRYSGTPLKYSFSECGDTKAVQVIDLSEKGTLNLSQIPLIPLREMREIRGTYAELTDLESYKNTNTTDYIHVTLTDEEDIPYALEKLRTIYKNILRLDYDNRRTRSTVEYIESAAAEQSPSELFAALYERQNGGKMSDEQIKIIDEFIEKAREVE